MEGNWAMPEVSEPDHGFEAGDVVVAVGTTEGLAQLRALLAS